MCAVTFIESISKLGYSIKKPNGEDGRGVSKKHFFEDTPGILLFYFTSGNSRKKTLPWTETPQNCVATLRNVKALNQV